jgi:hypothetical protein
MASFIGRCSITAVLGLGLALGRASVGDSAEPNPAPDFSADIVSRDAAGALLGGGGRLYASGRKVRIETPDVPAGFFLIGGDLGAALFVGTTQRVFMDAKQSTRLTQIFVPVDPHDPCPQWRVRRRMPACRARQATGAAPAAPPPAPLPLPVPVPVPAPGARAAPSNIAWIPRIRISACAGSIPGSNFP